MFHSENTIHLNRSWYHIIINELWILKKINFSFFFIQYILKILCINCGDSNNYYIHSSSKEWEFWILNGKWFEMPASAIYNSKFDRYSQCGSELIFCFKLNILFRFLPKKHSFFAHETWTQPKCISKSNGIIFRFV